MSLSFLTKSPRVFLSHSPLQHADLSQHRGLVPVDTLGGHFAIVEIDYNYHLDGNPCAGRRHARQKPVHLFGMTKTYRGLFDHAAVGRDTIGERMFPL